MPVLAVVQGLQFRSQGMVPPGSAAPGPVVGEACAQALAPPPLQAWQEHKRRFAVQRMRIRLGGGRRGKISGEGACSVSGVAAMFQNSHLPARYKPLLRFFPGTKC